MAEMPAIEARAELGVIEPDEVGFLVIGDWCDRCGDVNYDEVTRVCITCTEGGSNG